MRHWNLTERSWRPIGHALDQLSRDGVLAGGDHLIRADRGVLLAALGEMLLDAADDLSNACRGALDASGLAAPAEQHNRIGELLALLRTAYDTTSRPGVLVRVAPDVATAAAALARMHGRTVEDIVRQAVLTYLRKAGEIDG